MDRAGRIKLSAEDFGKESFMVGDSLVICDREQDRNYGSVAKQIKEKAQDDRGE